MAEPLSPDTRDMKANAEQASAFLKKLANPDRLMIVCTLVEGERTVRELEDSLGIRQPGLSQQLAELRKAGLVSSRKVGRTVYCRLADPRAEAFVTVMHSLFCQTSPNESDRDEEPPIVA